MNYQQTLQYLYSRLPMFTRIGVQAYKKDLTNTLLLCKNLDNPHLKFKSIHVGGTNGKGSTSHMLAAVLQTAGYKTGLYTSPHLKDFRERIKINGEMISQQEIIDFTKNQQSIIEEISPSFFEVTVAMAFNYFANEQVDIAVIEVGLGGRLDSTNIIEPELSIITNIGMDHMNLLGDTLQKIAYEKAGIIKPGTPVIIGEYQEEVADIFLETAQKQQSKASFASKDWKIDLAKADDLNNVNTLPLDVFANAEDRSEIDEITALNLDLTGTYQVKNVKTVLSAVKVLNKLHYKISKNQVLEALFRVKTLTGLMGRWQILQQQPLIICDTGHNEDGIKEVLQNISRQKYNQLHIVIGMVKDKEIGKILSLLPKEAIYYFTQPNIERAKPAKDLAEEATKFNLKGTDYLSVQDALKAAKTAAKSQDFIFIGGSTFVVAEVV